MPVAVFAVDSQVSYPKSVASLGRDIFVRCLDKRPHLREHHVTEDENLDIFSTLKSEAFSLVLCNGVIGVEGNCESDTN